MYSKNAVFIAACLGMFLFGVVFLSLGTVSVFIQEKFLPDPIRVASLASSLPVGILVGSLLFGPMVDRYGYKLLLILSAGTILLAFELIAFARSFTLLQISFFLIGAGGGMINGGTNALVADISSGEKSARLSLLGVFYGIGALGMPLVIGSLTQIFSYEAIIAAVGLFVIIPCGYFIWIKFPEPRHKQGLPVTEVFSLLKEPVLILIGLVLFFESALEGITGNWTTTYLKSGPLTMENALFALSLQVAAITAARFLLSYVLRSISSPVVMYLSFALVFTGAVLLILFSSLPMVLLAMVCLGAGFAAGFPVMLGYVGELYAKITGTAFSIVIVMALAGNSLFNYLVGLLSEAWGIRYFPVIMVFCVLCMALLYTKVISKISRKIKV